MLNVAYISARIQKAGGMSKYIQSVNACFLLEFYLISIDSQCNFTFACVAFTLSEEIQLFSVGNQAFWGKPVLLNLDFTLTRISTHE